MSKNTEKKPRLRFPEFTDNWELHKLNEVADYRNGKAHENEIESSGVGKYIVVNSKFVSTDGDVKKYSNNQIEPLYKDEIAFVLSDVPNGKAIARTFFVDASDKYTLNQRIAGIKAHNNIDPYYLYIRMNRNPYFLKFDDGNKQTNLSVKDVLNYEDFYPSYAEQKKNGNFFRCIDNIIFSYKYKLEILQNIKKGFLQKLFPKEGATNPELRFPGFNDDWEHRRFFDLVEIERGSSPRPIDVFITNNKNGLNWVKIGDAPKYGNYITKTEEKIIPEGLSKTRQVHPGDLILSNSMSFGKPYIMAIDGCIHDGWLLIRNTKNKFDLKYLCHMLSTESMHRQYVAKAAGSTVNNLNKELVGSSNVPLTNYEEQKKIGLFLELLETFITLYQQKLEILQNIKKGLLQQMFV